MRESQRTNNLFVLLILLAIPAAGLAQQLRAITKADYDSARNGAIDKAEKILRRVITETTKYKNGQIDSFETLTKETFPNGDERWHSVTRKDGRDVDSLDLIYLGKYEYRKEGKTDWVKRCVRDCSKEESSGGMSLKGKELPKFEEFLKGQTTLNGQPATLYVFYRVYDFGKTLDFYHSSTWIDANGLILREEGVTSDIFPTNKTISEVETYEYNPKDVPPLEAPIK